MSGFFNGSQELIVTDRFQEEIEGTDFVALECIFLEGCSKDDTCFGRNHVGEFHSVHIRHLDVKEQQVNGMALYHCDGFHGIGEAGHQFQVFGSGYEGFKQFHGQRLVVNNDTGHRGSSFRFQVSSYR